MLNSKENKENISTKKSGIYCQIKCFIFNKVNRRYVVFVMISSSVWAFIKLSKEYSTIKTFTFKVEQLPKFGFIIKKKSYPTELMVRGSGFSLLSYNLFQPHIPIYFKSQIIQNKNQFFIYPTELTKYLRSHLRDHGLVLIETSNKPIRLELNVAKTKEVPIIIDIQIDFKEGFGMLDSLQIRPSSVILTGSEEDLEKIHSIKTVPIELHKISKSFKMKKSLVNPLPGNEMSLNIPNIEIEGKVDKFTEKLVEVPIEILNIPQDVKLSFFPESVKLSFSLPLEKYDQVSSKDFKVICLFNKLNKEDSFMIPKITKKPDFIQGLDMHEKRIEFIIKQ